jgi:hypothetical protein
VISERPFSSVLEHVLVLDVSLATVLPGDFFEFVALRRAVLLEVLD